MTCRIFCVCGHETRYHNTSGRCLLQCSDESECPCTKTRPETVQIDITLYRLYPMATTETPRSDNPRIFDEIGAAIANVEVSTNQAWRDAARECLRRVAAIRERYSSSGLTPKVDK